MKKLFSFLFTFALLTILLAGSANAQIPVTVTNPTNTTPNLQANYSSLALALTDLNLVTAMTGPVTLTLTGGNSEIAPPTGLVIGSASLNPVLSATNTVLINTSGVVTLNAGIGTATPASAAPDGILAIVGADYITIDGITFTDGNATNPESMEFGVGLFKLSASDGAQYNTIQNCIFNMQRVNNAAGTLPMVEGSVGIRVVNATNTAATTALTPLSAAGSNSYNKFYTNIINSGNYGISIYGYADVTPFTLGDTGNDIGGSSSGQGNQILNFGGAAAATNPSAGIRVTNQWGVNISYNMINNNNGGGVNHVSTLRGIYAQSGTSASVTISHNTITLNGGGTTSQISAIENGIGATAASNTINITDNLITNCTNNTTTTGAWYGIYNNGASASTLNITNNTFTNNVSKATSGSTYLIYNNSAVASAININNNNLSAGFNNTAAYTGIIYSIYNGSGTLATNLNINLNNFSNYNFASYTNSGSLYFIYNANSSANTTFNGNTWTNLSLYHSGTEYLIYNSSSTQVALNVTNNSIVTAYNRLLAAGSMYCYYSGSSSLGSSSQTFSGNNFSNITANVNGTGTFYGLYSSDGASSPYPLKTVFNNTFSNITYKTSGTFYGIYMSYLGTGGTAGGSSIYNNTISNVIDSGTTYCLYSGSTANATYATNIYGNNFNNVTSLGLTQTLYAYLLYASTPGVNFYKNKAYNITATGTTASAFGIYTNSAYPYNISNNLIGNITTPNTSIVAAPYLSMAGIFFSSGSTINCVYNSVYLNGTSTGANFTSAAVVGTITPTSINMQDNIFVNLSTPKGLGKTVAYARNGTAWTNYAATSNNNLFYAGTPSATNVICSDGTNSYINLSDYKPVVVPRDGSAITENPNFLSTTGSDPTFLHINPAIATQIESGGIPSSPLVVTTDWDGDARNATTPDIGADEFIGIPLDATPPVIAYTPLGNTPGTGSRVLTASVTDLGSGVPTAGIGLPVLYWKINAGGYAAATGSYVSGSNYSFTFGAGVVMGDVVSYYVCAQDLAATPNVGGYPAGGSGYTANPPAAGVPTTTPSTYIISDVALAGDYTVGLTMFNKVAGRNITFEKVTKKVMKEVLVEEKVEVKEPVKGENIKSETSTSSTVISRKEIREVEEVSWMPMENGKVYNGNLYVKKSENPNLNYPMNVNGIYATITAAVADLNLRGVSGATRFLLNDATYPTETYPITVKVMNENLPTAVNTVTVKPNTGITASVSGASAAGQIFKILNSYVSIDGSNTIGGNTRDLTIENTSITTPQVVVIGSTGTTPIVGCGIKNCIIINGVNSSSAVIVSDGAAPGTAGWFNNITIQNNSIQKAYIALYTIATVSSGNGSGLNIIGNDFNSVAPNAVRLVGVYCQGIDGATVSNNNIGNFAVGSDGVSTTGIWFATGTVNSTISNNTISPLPGLTTASPRGIAVSSGLANANINITGNTISDITTAYASAPMGIYVFSTTSGVSVRNNKVSGLLNSNTGGYGARGINVISAITPANITVANNFIWNIAATSDVGVTYWPIGIVVDAAISNVNVYYNSVNLYGTLAGYTTATNSAALYVGSTVTASNVMDNILVNSFDNTTVATDKAYAIYSAAPNTAYTDINYNDYFVSGTPGVLGYLGADQTTLALWQTATGKDANSVSGDPKFNLATDLHIQTSVISPVSNAGTPIAAVLNDIDGDVRNVSTPDIGADEYIYVEPSVLDPVSFTATAFGPTQIDLAFTPNAVPNNVVIVWNLTGTFTAPSGPPPALGQPFAGGTLIVNGLVSPYNHTGLTPATIHYYKAFSYDGDAVAYSPGLSANATTLTPTIIVNPASLAFGYVPSGGTSAEKADTLSAINLTPASGNITVTPPANFEISLTGGGIGFVTTPIDVPYTAGTLAKTTIYSRFKPTTPGIAYSDSIMNAGGGAVTKKVTVTGSSALIYCAATSTTCDEYIGRVQLGTIDNSSTCNHYSDYTAISTSLMKNVTYPITITNPVPYSSDQCGIWVDWNGNGDFTDAGETVYAGAAPSSILTTNLTVPLGANLGPARMRIRILYTGTISSCGTTTYGEVEDYTINVTPPLPNDVGTTVIYMPTDINPPAGSIIPVATVKNLGTDAQTFPVNMTITGGYTSTKTVTALAPGDTAQVTFDSWTVAKGGYTVNVCTQLVGDGNPSNDCMNKTVWAYTGAWTSGTAIPTAGSTYLGSGVSYMETIAKTTTGYMFSIGGNTASALGTECYKYNVNTDTWTAIASLPVGRRVLATANVGHYLYAIGGSDVSSVYQSTVYKYDINNDAGGWTTVASLPIALGWGKALGYNDKIYFAGGYSGSYSSAVYVYDTTSNAWSAATSMPGPKFGGAFSIVGNQLVYVAGADDLGISSSVYVGTIDAINPLLITWAVGASYPGLLDKTPVFTSENTTDSKVPVVINDGKSSGKEKTKVKSTNQQITKDNKMSVNKTGSKNFNNNGNDLDSPYPGGTMYRFDGAPWGDNQMIVATGSPTSAWTPAVPSPCWIYKPSSNTWLKQGNALTPVLGASLGSVHLGNDWKLVVATGYTGALTTVTQIWTDTYISVPQPVFSVTPTTKNFGAIQVGLSTPNQTFMITNLGTLNLVITSLTKAGTDPGQFVLTDSNTYPLTLAPGASAYVYAKFSPTTVGAKSAELSFVDNATGSPHIATLSGTATAGTWTSLGNSGVTTALYSVSVVDNNVAFISGANGVVLRTTNAGGSWTNISSAPISTTVSCDVVRGIDANTALTTQYDGANGHMYKTTNGGTTWTEVLFQAGGFFDDIRFKDANNGFMYGDPVGARWSLWKTTNGGTTWDSTGLYLPQVSAEAGWDNALALEGDNLWFGTNSSHTYRSTNFGASWTSAATVGLINQYSLTFSGNIGFATANGVMNKSTDAGVTWSSFVSPGTGSSHITSLGERFFYDATNVYYSTDNGTTFPLSYTYPGTGGAMWGIGANLTSTHITVFVSGATGGIYKYTEEVAAPSLTLGLTAMFSGQTNISGTMNFTKDVTVELHAATTPYALVESKAVTLDLNGLANPVYTTAVNGTPYYIVIRSNNGLETWSATPQTFTGSTLSYDFTTAATQAYGSNMLLVGTKWCIISGDADQNGTINAVDRSLCWNDRNLVGVYSTDFDGNGTVNALDRSIAWNNRNLSVAKPVLALSPESKGVRQETKDNKDNKGKTKGTYDLKLDSKNAKKVTKNK